MTSRERLRRTLNHSEPGRVVVDLGSTSITGISASALARLRKALGLPEKTVRVHEPFQILGFVDEDVLQALGCDVMGVWPLGTMFGYNNDRWKPWQLFDGTQVMIGEGFTYSEDSNGNIYLHPNRNWSIITAKTVLRISWVVINSESEREVIVVSDSSISDCNI